jgi:hypothetical protein
MKNQFNEMLKPKSRAGQTLLGFILGGATIAILSAVAIAGYGVGKDLRAKHDREAAQDVRQGD